MKLTNNVSYPCSVPCFVDLGKYVAINGQVYTYDLSPIPFNFMKSYDTYAWANPVGSTHCSPSAPQVAIASRLDSGDRQHLCNNFKGIFETDKSNPNVIYNRTSGARNGAICKTTIGESGIVESVFGNTHDLNIGRMHYIIGQDNEYIYNVCSYDYNDGGNYDDSCIFSMVSKTSLAASTHSYQGAYNNNTNYRKCFEKIAETDSFIYVYASGFTSHNDYYIFCVKKATSNSAWAITNLKYKNPGNVSIQMISTKDVSRNKSKIVFYVGEPKDDSGSFYIDIYKNEVDNLSGVFTPGSEPVARVPISKTYSAVNMARAIITKIGDDVFLTLVLCDFRNNSAPQYISEVDNNIYTFVVNEDYSLTGCDPVPVNNNITYSDYLTRKNGTQMIMVHPGGGDFYEFDVVKQQFVFKYSYFASIKEMWLDSNERVWARHSDNSIHLFNESTPINIDSSFENNNYSYNGSDIQSSVRVSAINFNNEGVDCDVEVSLSGNCKFTDGSKSKLSRVSKNGTSIPIVINGPGMIESSCRLIKE